MGTSWSSKSTYLKDYYNQQAAEQIALQNVIFEHRWAMHLAESRKFIANEYLAALLAVSLMLLSQRLKAPYLYIIPAAPVFTSLCYSFDQQRDVTVDYINEKAKQLRKEKRYLFEPIGGPITLAEIDRRILRAKYHRLKSDEEVIETNQSL